MADETRHSRYLATSVVVRKGLKRDGPVTNQYTKCGTIRHTVTALLDGDYLECPRKNRDKAFTTSSLSNIPNLMYIHMHAYVMDEAEADPWI